jgi:ATP-binding cassette, subfamily B, heavy metal transporter
MSDAATEAGAGPGWKVLRRFLPYLWPKGEPALRARVVIAVLLVLLAKGVSLSTGFVYKAAIDRMVPGMEPVAGLAIGLVVAYAGARFAGVFFENVRNAIFERVGLDAARRFADTVFRHIHALSLRFHLERRTGALTKIVERGIKSIDMMLYFLLFNIAPTAVELAVICLIFGVKFGMGLVVATVVMVVAYIAFTRLVTEWRSRLQRRMNDMDNATVSRAVDSLLNYETVKYFNAEEREARRYDEALRSLNEIGIRNETSLAWLNVGQSSITNLMMGGAMAYTVWGWSRGAFTTGDVVLVNTLLAQLFRPLDVLGWVYRTIRQGLVDMEAMFGLLDTPAEIQDAPEAFDLDVRAGHVRFENVRFGYEPEREILKGIDLEVKPGTMTAVVGPSGAGKSTLSRLLFRFYDVTRGEIRVNGLSVKDIRQSSLRAAIGIVPQDTVLFNDTILYNIRYGRPEASDEEIFEAARAAHIHDFIVTLPLKYETMVGERGLKLSGGEKQRVAIARALLKNPRILIFDEATSALDSRAEKAIQGELERISQGRTTLVIAHRLSTVMDADQILVLAQGRIVERGSHAQLLEAKGEYARMWALQQQQEHAQAILENATAG